MTSPSIAVILARMACDGVAILVAKKTTWPMTTTSVTPTISIGCYANGALAVSLIDKMAIIETSAAAIR
jgi:hypothetical protein